MPPALAGAGTGTDQSSGGQLFAGNGKDEPGGGGESDDHSQAPSEISRLDNPPLNPQGFATAEADFGEKIYHPAAVPPPHSATLDKKQVIRNARRKSSLLPKGPEKVKSRFLEGDLGDNGAGNKANKYLKGKGGAYTAREIALSITKQELHSLLSVENPKKELELVGAAVLIMLSPGRDIPKEVAWGSFKKEIKGNSFPGKIASLNSSNIKGFKARALKPFLQNDKFLPGRIANTSVGAAKLAAWAFVALRGVPEFEWPEGLDLKAVLEGMDKYIRPKNVEHAGDGEGNGGGEGGGGEGEGEEKKKKKKKKKVKPISERLAAPKRDFSQPDYPVREVVKQVARDKTKERRERKEKEKEKKNNVSTAPAAKAVIKAPAAAVKKSPAKAPAPKSPATKSPATKSPAKAVPPPPKQEEDDAEDPEKIFADEYGDDFADDETQEETKADTKPKEEPVIEAVAPKAEVQPEPAGVMEEEPVESEVVESEVVESEVVESEVEEPVLEPMLNKAAEEAVADDDGEDDDYGDEDDYDDEFEAESPAKPGSKKTPASPPGAPPPMTPNTAATKLQGKQRQKIAKKRANSVRRKKKKTSEGAGGDDDEDEDDYGDEDYDDEDEFEEDFEDE